jgi:hypothetical protein
MVLKYSPLVNHISVNVRKRTADWNIYCVAEKKYLMNEYVHVAPDRVCAFLYSF